MIICNSSKTGGDGIIVKQFRKSAFLLRPKVQGSRHKTTRIIPDVKDPTPYALRLRTELPLTIELMSSLPSYQK